MTDSGIVMMSMSGLVAAAYSITVIARAVIGIKDRQLKLAEMKTGSVSDERMARMEMAVESIAVEVERISEGQRFTTRLLTEQGHPLTPRIQPGKFDTPH
jgi:hypothetical protein